MYDSYGNKTSVTDSNGHTTAYAYDSANQLTCVTDAVGKITVYGYDGYGRSTKVGAGTDGTIDPTEYFFDDTTGRVTKTRYTSGGTSYDADYAFDSYGALTRLTDWNSTNGMQYAYDGYGRLTCLTDYNGAYLAYGYDGYGRTTSMRDYHGATTTYAYTTDSRLSTVTAPGSMIWAYSYDGYKQLTKVDIPNGMATEYAYDTLGRQTTIQHKDGNTVVQGFTYAYANDNNISQITNHDGTKWSYQYDNQLRLTQAERYSTDGTTLLHRYSYAYDNGDNMLSKAVYDATTQTTVSTSMAYDNANELTSTTAGGVTTSYAYDAWGRTTAKADGTHSATYAYKYGSKLGSLTSTFPGEADAVYEYNGSGKQIARTTGGLTKRYRYDAGWNVVNEENGSGVLTRTMVLRNPKAKVAGLLADVEGSNPVTGTARFYNTDLLGSTRSLYDSSKSVLGMYDYIPYGETYTTTGSVSLSELSVAFTGKPFDLASGLYHFPYRYYNPETARWLTRDPLGMVDGPNVYVYVGGDPANYLDPSGLLSGGLGGSAAIEIGNLLVAMGIQVGGLIGIFSDGTVGAVASCGVIGGVAGNYEQEPQVSDSLSAILGMYAGIGGNVWVSNASNAQDLKGPFKTLSVNLAFIYKLGTFQISWGQNDKYEPILVGSYGPPGWGAGVGADASLYDTYTAVLGEVGCSKCKR